MTPEVLLLLVRTGSVTCAMIGIALTLDRLRSRVNPSFAVGWGTAEHGLIEVLVLRLARAPVTGLFNGTGVAAGAVRGRGADSERIKGVEARAGRGLGAARELVKGIFWKRLMRIFGFEAGAVGVLGTAGELIEVIFRKKS